MLSICFYFFLLTYSLNASLLALLIIFELSTCKFLEERVHALEVALSSATTQPSETLSGLAFVLTFYLFLLAYSPYC